METPLLKYEPSGSWLGKEREILHSHRLCPVQRVLPLQEVKSLIHYFLG